MLPDCIVPEGPSKGLVRVTRSLQVAVPKKTGGAQSGDLEVADPHLFAVGNCADAFGAVASGRTAHYEVSSENIESLLVLISICIQGEMAAKNILKLIARDEGKADATEELEQFNAPPPAIKLTIGLVRKVQELLVFLYADDITHTQRRALLEMNGRVGMQDDLAVDLDSPGVWTLFGLQPTEEMLHE
jgi:apoptosis-inducing factor 2